MSHLVSCKTCRDEGRKSRWEQTCELCAETFAHKHRTETGHHVELTVTSSEERLPADSRTVRMLGRPRW
jgi:hypothetical protein